jgi:hypothetical protein
VTGTVSGLPRSRQFGSSSSSARVDHRAGEDVGADLGALLEDADGEVAAGLGGELLQADRGGEARRAGADDDDVVRHRLAFGHAVGRGLRRDLLGGEAGAAVRPDAGRRSAATARPSISPPSRPIRSPDRADRRTEPGPPAPRSRATTSAWSSRKDAAAVRRCLRPRRWSALPVAGARGKWHALETAAGPVKTLVTIKPEKLNDMPAMKKLAWADLQLLMEALN